jgi:hypothetical protein
MNYFTEMCLKRCRTKFVGFNALLVAAFYRSNTGIVDFLLAKGCGPSERDARE